MFWTPLAGGACDPLGVPGPPRPHFAIARWTGTAWRDGRLGNAWEPLRGRRYPTSERAAEAFDQLAWRHDQQACDGRIAPNQLGRFEATHRIVALEDGHFPVGERWLPTDMAATPFTPGERLVWTHSERHRDGHSGPVTVTVVRCASTRVLVEAPRERGTTKQVWVSPSALRRASLTGPEMPRRT